MNQKRFRKSVVIAIGFFFLCTAARLTRAQSASPSAVQAPKAPSPGAQPKKDASADDFAGLQYSDEQKTEIDHIRQDMKSRKDAVVKDQTLTADQKDAMLLGYTRMENGLIYKTLTPDQRRQVSKRMHERQAADKASQTQQPQPAHPQPPRN
jgi:hypothetical protein